MDKTFLKSVSSSQTMTADVDWAFGTGSQGRMKSEMYIEDVLRTQKSLNLHLKFFLKGSHRTYALQWIASKVANQFDEFHVNQADDLEIYPHNLYRELIKFPRDLPSLEFPMRFVYPDPFQLGCLQLIDIDQLEI